MDNPLGPHSNVKVFGTGTRARCAWEVRAGVLPSVPIPEHTKIFTVTSDTYYADLEMKDEEFKAKYPDGNGVFKQAQKEAYDYALSLHDPRSFNWVAVDWIYY